MSNSTTLNWRYATKVFDPEKKISDSDLQDLKDSLRLSPSSYGLQPWHFLVITDPELLAELRPHSWDQAQVTDCSHFFVLCARTGMDEQYIMDYAQNVADTRGIEVSDIAMYVDMMKTNVLEGKSETERQSWMEKQVYIALGFLMSACAEKQIDSCPMEGLDKTEYDRILKLPEKGWTTVVACPVGYRAADDKYASLAKVRWPESETIEAR